MPRVVAGGKPLRKIQIRVFAEDDDEIERMASADMLKADIYRNIIHAFVRQAGATIRAKIDELSPTDNILVD